MVTSHQSLSVRCGGKRRWVKNEAIIWWKSSVSYTFTFRISANYAIMSHNGCALLFVMYVCS